MKFGVLQSIVHNAADSLGSGIGFMIGTYEMDIYAEAGQSPGGAIAVDFLTGKVIEGEASPGLRKAVELYRTAFDELCVRHGVEPWSFKVATARFGTDAALGRHFTVHVVDREARAATDRFIGSPGRRL
ncbi:MAG: hypothetical protein KKG14_14235 [Alphaproteobacteria bacterium]|nr:hypothetical protein [Alphaproteobacteria bacterium]MBU2271066.1 hypothetical protein [Alphaproteobacteria bacterium]MBU2419856.1 hypothetical protein [Alphaproteobacteria bacterium]